MKTDSAANHLTVRCLDMDRMPHVGNFALLQWRVVDVAAQCNLITIARRTRQTSSDKSATASNAGRYAQHSHKVIEKFCKLDKDYSIFSVSAFGYGKHKYINEVLYNEPEILWT